MRKKSMFSSVLGILVVVALGVGGYTFFKDLEGPVIDVSPNTGRVSPASVLKVSMKDPSGIRSVTVGVRKNNVLNVIFNKHFDQYLPERTVEVPLKDANLREGAFDLEVRATDGSLAGFGQGNTRTVQLPMRLDTQPPRISVKTLPPNVRRGGAAVVRYTVDEDVTNSGGAGSRLFCAGLPAKRRQLYLLFPFSIHYDRQGLQEQRGDYSHRPGGQRHQKPSDSYGF